MNSTLFFRAFCLLLFGLMIGDVMGGGKIVKLDDDDGGGGPPNLFHSHIMKAENNGCLTSTQNTPGAYSVIKEELEIQFKVNSDGYYLIELEVVDTLGNKIPLINHDIANVYKITAIEHLTIDPNNPIQSIMIDCNFNLQNNKQVYSIVISTFYRVVAIGEPMKTFSGHYDYMNCNYYVPGTNPLKKKLENEEGIKMWYDSNSQFLVIQDLPANTYNVEWINLHGIVQKRMTLEVYETFTKSKFRVQSIPTGIYVVKLSGNSKAYFSKIIIK